MTILRYMVGDVFDRLAEIPDESVDLVLTSPPFLALRSYLPDDHPDKHLEIGGEPTPAAFIDTLLHLTAEWRRVLAPHGSIAVELGDTYSGSGGSGGDYSETGIRAGQNGFTGSGHRSRHTQPRQWAGGVGWPRPKSLTLIPEAYRFALVYGFSPFTGPTVPSPAGEWLARNVVRWVRTNPPVGALGDKFRPATSEIVIACTSPRRFFDLAAVSEPATTEPRPWTMRGDPQVKGIHPDESGRPKSSPVFTTAPPLDWWQIGSALYSGSHFAVWPGELLTRPIKAMCPERVCLECGVPWFRSENPDCICESGAYRAGMVLDPFAGTGTTLAVAHGHGRDAIGIDIDERNADLALDRVGPMFLEISHREQTTRQQGEPT